MSSLLQIELRPSRALRIAQCVLALLALLALWLSAAPPWALLAVPLLMLLDWPGRIPSRHDRLRLHPDGAATVVDRDGAEAVVTIDRLQWRGPLCVITVVDGRHRHRHVLTSDLLSPARRRALRLWFDRFGSASSQAGAAAHV